MPRRSLTQSRVALATLVLAPLASLAAGRSLADPAAMWVGPEDGAVDLMKLPAPPPGRNPFDGELTQIAGRLTRDAGRPEGAVPLLELPALWDEVLPARLLDVASRVADSPRTYPLVRARAAYLAASVLDALGHDKEADARRQLLGFVTRFRVLGPFDNDGRGGFDRVFPPEGDLAASLRAPVDGGASGLPRQLSWRDPGNIDRAGVVFVGAAVRPAENVVAYALTFVRAARATSVAVRTGSTGALAVWVGAPEAMTRVLSKDAYRPFHLDQDVALVRLPAGWTAVLVKVASESAAPEFALRFTRPDGEPLPEGLVSVDPDPAHLAFALPVGKPASRDVPASVEGALRARVDRLTDGDVHDPTTRRTLSGALLDLGIYLREVAPGRPEDHEAEGVLRRAAALAGDAESLHEQALAESEYDLRRQDEVAALALLAPGDPRRAPLDVDIADSYASRGEPRADALFAEALACDPSYFPARLRLAELAADRGLPAEGMRAVAPLLAALPGVGEIQRAALDLYERTGMVAEGAALRRDLLLTHSRDVSLLRGEGAALRAMGDTNGALAMYRRAASSRPGATEEQIALSSELLGAGRGADGVDVLRAALAQSPDEPRLHHALADAELQLGHEREARTELEQTLALKPQSPDVREYLAHMDATTGAHAGEDLASEFRRDVPSLIAATKERPRGTEAGVVLLDLQATRLYENGLSQVFVERVVRIDDPARTADFADFGVRYEPDTQTIDIREARIYKPDGSVVQPVDRDDRQVSPEYGMYYDEHEALVGLPGLVAGDVIDIEYVLSDVGHRNLMADYFGDLHLFQEDLPRNESDYFLVAPRDRALFFHEPTLPRLEKSVKDDATVGTRTYSWVARDVAKVPDEPGMPGETEVAQYLHVSTYKDWADAGAFYWGLVKDQLSLDDEMRAAALAAVTGATSDLDKVRRIHRLVVTQTHYVGLEFGIHGYKPYRTTQVFERKFGDCKDKASLLVVLLRAVGVPAELVAVRTRDMGDLDPVPASLAIFDHAIAYVPSLDLYLDGTAEFSGTGELPAQDQGVVVMRLHDGKGLLTRTPVFPASANVMARDLAATLAPDGSVIASESLDIEGQQAAAWREQFQAPDQRTQRYEAVWNARHPGTRVTRVDMSDLSDLDRPVDVRAEVVVPALAHAAAGTLRLPVLGHAGQVTQTYARLSHRETDLLLSYPWTQRETVTWTLPPGYHVETLPNSVALERPFGRFTLSISRQGEQVVARTETVVTTDRVTRADYPAFRAFCDSVDQALNQELILAK